MSRLGAFLGNKWVSHSFLAIVVAAIVALFFAGMPDFFLPRGLVVTPFPLDPVSRDYVILNEKTPFPNDRQKAIGRLEAPSSTARTSSLSPWTDSRT